MSQEYIKGFEEELFIDHTDNKNSFLKVSKIDDFEFTLNIKKFKNPVDILEKLYILHQNESLTTEEKNKKVQSIIKEYVE